MLKKLDLNSNVPSEATKKPELWKNLSIHPNDSSFLNIHPYTSRVNSKENLLPHQKFQSKPIFQAKGSETYRTHSSNYREEKIIDKQLETIESKLAEINILKIQLQTSYREKKEDLRRREKELIKNEQEFKKQYLAFEEERDKWCSHISFKLKEIQYKEKAMEFDRSTSAGIAEKSAKAEEMWSKRQKDLQVKSEKLIEAQANYVKREEILSKNEERLNMVLEDLAGYEQRIVDYEKMLMRKGEEMGKAALKIEAKRGDIEKTAEMFEKIHEQLQTESKRLMSKEQFLIKEEARLRSLNRLKSDISLSKKSQVFQNYTLEEVLIYQSPETNSSSECLHSPYNVRTPE